MPAPRILIVDDSAFFRKSIENILEPLDSEIILARDGQQGLDLAMHQNFDIVISDIEMPKVNGIKLCHSLKNTPETQGIPIIMVSLFDSDRDVDKGFKAGASAYIPKDDLKDRLLETVQSILSKTRFNHDRLIQVKVQPGMNEGTRLRLKGLGKPTVDGGRGDLYLRIRILPLSMNDT